MHALSFAADALDASRHLLGVLATVIPSRALFVHHFDAQRRQFVVVDAAGPAGRSALLYRAPARDQLLSAAFIVGHPLVWRDLGSGSTRAITRLDVIGGATDVLVAPVGRPERSLGAIELVDPAYGECFEEDHRNAVGYVAARYEEVLAEHGVVLDGETLLRHAGVRA
jgi:hypothetical protein